MTEEHSNQDDAIIGRAFRWSVLAIGLVAGAIAIGWFVRMRLGAPTETVVQKDTGQIRSFPKEAPTMPAIPFRDITQSAGIGFVHQNGAVGEKLLPETMGPGVAIFDFDGDDQLDLFFVNGTPWDGSATATHKLYRNLGDATFDDVTAEAGIESPMYGMGCAVGDYDNDGDEDLFVTALGKNQLLENRGGRFVDVTEDAGVSGDKAWSTSAGFFDFDRDGDLDLFVCNYVQWTREIDFELNYSLNGTDRAYGPPTDYKGAHPFLYRNEGDGTFSDVTAEAGLQITNGDSPAGKSLAVVLTDLDDDGWDDIVVANDTVGNFLFHNQKVGTFKEIGAASGIAFDRNGKATGAMGIDAGFPRAERKMAIGIGNFATEMTSYYVAQRMPMTFADESLLEGIGAPSRARLTFGLFFFDADLDGRQDMFQANGHLEEEINQIQPSQTYRQPAQLFWNCGDDADTCFLPLPDDMAMDLQTPYAARAAAYGDLDGDGDLDIVLTQVGGPAIMLRNEQQTHHHWIRLRLIGSDSPRDAIGAKIQLTQGDKKLYRTVSATRSYLSQTELPVTFGLNNSTQIDSIQIDWPSGKQQTITGLQADRMHTIRESDP